MGWGETLASIGGLALLAIGLSELGARLGELIDRAFGAPLRHEGDGAVPPVPDDVQ
ncbi:MAG: hypothetical protein QOG72_2438 [Sphingomonadales bacterium]|jgi:hypothetical protein|nr:hypothetical protein [Sphingomonadales bacterium]